MISSRFLFPAAEIIMLCVLAGFTASQNTQTTEPAKAAAESAIRFAFQPIDFELDSDESPEHHAPETME